MTHVSPTATPSENLEEIRRRIAESKRRLDEIDHQRNFGKNISLEDAAAKFADEEARLRAELAGLRQVHEELANRVEGEIETRLPFAVAWRGWWVDYRLWIYGAVAFLCMIGFFVLMIESYLVMPRASLYSRGSAQQRALISPQRLGNLDDVDDGELILNTARGQRIQLEFRREFQQILGELEPDGAADFHLDLPLNGY